MIFFVLFYLFVNIRLLDVGSGDLLTELGEVRAHVALEVEVGELILSANLEERSEGGVRVNLTAVILILEGVSADILVDLTGHLSAGHLSALILAKEGGKLITDKGGLHKTTWGAVANLALAALDALLSSAELTSPTLLETTEVRAEGSELRTDLVELSEELSKLILKDRNLRRGGRGSLNNWLGNNRDWSRSGGSGGLRSGGARLASLLGRSGSRSRSRSGYSWSRGSGCGLAGHIIH
jgi:hypothetical protein